VVAIDPSWLDGSRRAGGTRLEAKRKWFGFRGIGVLKFG
jgi:hypothetical protein